jgi:hypothetical protein
MLIPTIYRLPWHVYPVSNWQFPAAGKNVNKTPTSPKSRKDRGQALNDSSLAFTFISIACVVYTTLFLNFYFNAEQASRTMPKFFSYRIKQLIKIFRLYCKG